ILVNTWANATNVGVISSTATGDNPHIVQPAVVHATQSARVVAIAGLHFTGSTPSWNISLIPAGYAASTAVTYNVPNAMRQFTRVEGGANSVLIVDNWNGFPTPANGLHYYVYTRPKDTSAYTVYASLNDIPDFSGQRVSAKFK